jgi:hypothetical protein
MGTRSLTFVYDEKYGRRKPKAIINMYRQYDGYPTGHGAELAKFLAPFEMVSGIPVKKDEEQERKVANGMGCLAAQLVSNFKVGAGQFYLYPTSAIDCGQDYEYHIYTKDGALRVGITNRGCNFFGLTTSDTNEKIFDGNLAEFTEFCTAKETA